MACLSCRVLPEGAGAGLWREQDCRSGGILSSSSSPKTGWRLVGRGEIAKENNNRRLRSSSWIRGSDFLKNELLCVVAAPPGLALSKQQSRKAVMIMSVKAAETSKILIGSGGAVLEDVPHLTDWLPDLPVRFFPFSRLFFLSPLCNSAILFRDLLVYQSVFIHNLDEQS